MTGLKAFELIKRVCELYIDNISYLVGSDIIGNQINEALNIIAKEIKALEILKKKGDLSALIDAKNVDDFNWYLCCEDKEHEFTEEEFELLKEVLK